MNIQKLLSEMPTDKLKELLIIKSRNLGGATVACELIAEELTRRATIEEDKNNIEFEKENLIRPENNQDQKFAFPHFDLLNDENSKTTHPNE